jgi:hypothetical protein
MTAAYMGAGYLGGAYLSFRVARNDPWHRVAAGFPAITAFTWAILLVTLLHWLAFAHGHLAFVLWLILYAVTPILVPALWLINRHADPGGAEAHDVRVPKAVRLGLGALGAGLLVFALAGWASPKWDDDRLAMGAIPAYRAGHVRLAEPCWAWVG